MTAGELSIAGGVGAAVQFWREATAKVWGALAVFAVVIVVVQSAQAAGAAPIWMLVGASVEIFASVLAYGALLRVAFAAEHPGDADFVIGSAGVQWGKPEWRLFGATLLLMLFYLFVAIGVIFLLFLVAVVFAAAEGVKSATATGLLHSPSGIAVVVVLIVCVIGIVWSSIRLSLSLPATVDRKQVQVFSVWSLTKGYAVTLLVAGVVCLLPGLILATAAVWLKFGLGAAMTLPEAVLIGAVVALVTVFVQSPLVIGLYSHFYRLLRVQGAGVASEPV